MRIVKDVDDDIWVEGSGGVFECVTSPDAISYSFDDIKEWFSPVTVFNGPKAADTSVYRATDWTGARRHYSRRGLASALSNPYTRRLTKIERVSEPKWEDVTAEFGTGVS